MKQFDDLETLELESLQAKFGYTPMRVDYIVVVYPDVAAKIVRLGTLAPKITIETSRVLPYTEYFSGLGRRTDASNSTDLCVCLLQVSHLRPGAISQDSISLNILYQAHIVVSLIDNKIEYIKDRSGVSQHTRTPEQRLQVFQADLVKWSKC
jgi:hypothetical protein